MKAPVSRREFLRHSARTGGLLGAGAALFSLAPVPARAAANKFAYDVERFARTDPSLLKYAPAGRFASPVANPRRIATDRGGRLLIAGREGLAIVEANGQPVRTLSLPGPGRAVAAGADGTVYGATRDGIEAFNAEGRRTGGWKVEGKKTWVTGLALASNTLLAADSGSRMIWRFDLEGKVIGKLAEKNKEREIPGLVLPSPYLDVKLGPDGLLRVNNPGRHRVELYTLDGDLELFWGKPTAGIEGFCGCCNPIAVCPLPDGRCITCEKGLPRVKVYAADGSFAGVVAGPESFPENGRAGAGRSAGDGSLGGLDAAVDAEGRVFVVDLVTAQVHVFKPLV